MWDGESKDPFSRKTPQIVSRSNVDVLLHIIDDITVVVQGWEEDDFIFLHKIMRNTVMSAKLPIKESKSRSIHEVVTRELPFIGCIWHRRVHCIKLRNEKFQKLQNYFTTFYSLGTISRTDSQSILGSLI